MNGVNEQSCKSESDYLTIKHVASLGVKTTIVSLKVTVLIVYVMTLMFFLQGSLPYLSQCGWGFIWSRHCVPPFQGWARHLRCSTDANGWLWDDKDAVLLWKQHQSERICTPQLNFDRWLQGTLHFYRYRDLYVERPPHVLVTSLVSLYLWVVSKSATEPLKSHEKAVFVIPCQVKYCIFLCYVNSIFVLVTGHVFLVALTTLPPVVYIKTAISTCSTFTIILSM